MHHNAADGVRTHPALFILAAVDALGDTDRPGTFPLVAELRRVMQHQDQAVVGGNPIAGRQEMPGEYIRLADSVVGEEPIGCLGVGPVLACQRNALSHGASDLCQHLAEPSRQAVVRESAAGKLRIQPCLRQIVHLRFRSQRTEIDESQIADVSVPYLMHGCDSGRAGPTELWVIERFDSRLP